MKAPTARRVERRGKAPTHPTASSEQGSATGQPTGALEHAAHKRLTLRTACPRIVPTPLTRAQTIMATKPEMTQEKLETLVNTVESLEENVNKLHDALEKKGVNSRGTKDIFGRVFSMPVQTRHCACCDSCPNPRPVDGGSPHRVDCPRAG